MKRKTKLHLTLASIAVLSIIAVSAFSDYLVFASRAEEPLHLKINDAVVTAEVAATPKQWEKGLGGRTYLGPNSGMLFVFPWRRNYVFWMQGMKIPIDILFIDDTQIVDIAENLPAPKAGDTIAEYVAAEKASRVLEVPAGWVAKHNVRRGDHVFILAQ
ncbi:MAG: DUF192 domain-containing protein [bacterium]|nr:DUF192 domain-containing protein [bacterium]